MASFLVSCGGVERIFVDTDAGAGAGGQSGSGGAAGQGGSATGGAAGAATGGSSGAAGGDASADGAGAGGGTDGGGGADTSGDRTPPDGSRPDASDVSNDFTADAVIDNSSDFNPADVGPDMVLDVVADASCPVGSYRCTGTNLEYCAGPDWVVRQTCATAALCDAVGGMCIQPTCLPNTYRCSGANLQICNADQNGWVDKAVCASAGLCDATHGVCATSACTPGTYQCSGATLQVCRSDQTGWDTVTVCASAPLCNAATGMCDTPPDTTIDTYPPNPSNSLSPSFTFSSTKMGSTFQCRVDGAAFAACTSPAVVAVGPGAHSFQVYAVDMGGVADPSPASYTWTVDNAPPTVTIVTHPVNPTKFVDASFSFSSTEQGTVECRIDAGMWGICSSSTTMQYVNLSANTAHTFEVRVTDAAQNVGNASFTWTIDTIAPTTTINNGPPPVMYIRDANFGFTANEASTFECSIDGAAFVSCTSPRAVIGLPVGSHTLTVRATDTAGNVEMPGASRSWNIAYPLTCTRAAVGATSSVGVSGTGVGGVPAAPWKVCRSDWTTWVSAGTNGGTYNAVAACRSIGYRSVPSWGGNANQVCVTESYNGGGGSDPSALSLTVEWLCDDCGSPPAVNTTGSVGVSGTGVGGVPAAAWKVCRSDWDTAWVAAGTNGGTYNAVLICQYLGYRTADAWGGDGNQVCVTESYNSGGGSDPTQLSLTVHWRCTY